MSKLLEDKAPAAHRLDVLVPLIALLDSGIHNPASLATALGISEEDASAHLKLARWLRWTRGAPPKLTSLGAVFARNPTMRQGMFVESVQRHPIMTQVRHAERLERDLRAACARAITAACRENPPDDADVARAAAHLAHLIRAARDADQIDWDTGALDLQEREVALTFEGRTFLTTLATRAFGAPACLQIGLPAQVITFCQPNPPAMPGWAPASRVMDEVGPAGERVLWFGSTPCTPQTLEVASARGKGLRKLLTTTTPHVTLLVAALCWRPTPEDAPPISLSGDGAQLVAHGKTVGALEPSLRRLMRGLGLELVEGLPIAPATQAAMAQDPRVAPHLEQFLELAKPAPLKQLIDALLSVGLLAPTEHATLALSPRFAQELDAPGLDGEPCLFERLAPLHADLNLLMRRFL
jgi:hypothetical protein